MKNASKKQEVRLAIDSDFLQQLEDRLNIHKSTELTRAALTLLDWASKEAEGGRVILSTDKEGKDAHRLVMPELSKVKEATSG